MALLTIPSYLDSACFFALKAWQSSGLPRALR